MRQDVLAVHEKVYRRSHRSTARVSRLQSKENEIQAIVARLLLAFWRLRIGGLAMGDWANWRLAIGVGVWRLAFWRLAIGVLAFGDWRLAIGNWRLRWRIGRLAMGDWRLAIGDWLV